MMTILIGDDDVVLYVDDDEDDEDNDDVKDLQWLTISFAPTFLSPQSGQK